MSDPIFTVDQIQQLIEMNESGDLVGAYGQMAEWGDSYADNAYQIFSNPDSIWSMIVSYSWQHVGADLSSFQDVAKSFQRNYIDAIAFNNGSLPTTQQIEQAYYDSLNENNIDPNAAIDSTLPASWWAGLIMLDGDRITASDVYEYRSFFDQMFQFFDVGFTSVTVTASKPRQPMAQPSSTTMAMASNMPQDGWALMTVFLSWTAMAMA